MQSQMNDINLTLSTPQHCHFTITNNYNQLQQLGEENKTKLHSLKLMKQKITV